MKFLTVILLLIVFSLMVKGQNVTLAWSSFTNLSVAGVNIYYGTTSGIYTNKTNAGTNTFLTISNIALNVAYYFVAKTYDTNNIESSNSTEVAYTQTWSNSTNYVPPIAFTIVAQVTTNTAPFPSNGWVNATMPMTNKPVWLMTNQVVSNSFHAPNYFIRYIIKPS